MFRCRNTGQNNEMSNTHRTHSKSVPECSAPMTKWLKCRNTTPDSEIPKHRRHTTTQCLSKATHPIGNNRRRGTLCKAATVHPHITYRHQHMAQRYTDHTYVLHPIQQRSMRMAPSDMYRTVYISIMPLYSTACSSLLAQVTGQMEAC